MPWRARTISKVRAIRRINLVRKESSPPSLEPHVLERLGGVPVLACSCAVVPPTRSKIAERYPCPSPVADG
jgi:hypothetical protein